MHAEALRGSLRFIPLFVWMVPFLKQAPFFEQTRETVCRSFDFHTTHGSRSSNAKQNGLHVELHAARERSTSGRNDNTDLSIELFCNSSMEEKRLQSNRTSSA
jgi:hypothetical protein